MYQYLENAKYDGDQAVAEHGRGVRVQGGLDIV